MAFKRVTEYLTHKTNKGYTSVYFRANCLRLNYLAHAYLSFGDSSIITGNLISDFVKGKKKFDYPPRILSGIDLHRSIDLFTDHHPVNKEAANIFKPAYGLYSAAFLDVVYDHFLAIDLAKKGQDFFLLFSEKIYSSVETFEPLLPDTFRQIFPYMKEQNWLYNYQFEWGIRRSLQGLVHRAKYINDSQTAWRLFEDHYQALAAAFSDFFPSLYAFSLEKFSDIH